MFVFTVYYTEGMQCPIILYYIILYYIILQLQSKSFNPHCILGLLAKCDIFQV